MRFSEKWLREWVSPDLTTVQLTEQLTMAGLEVDSINPAALPFRDVVIGKVKALENHPEASNLHICQIDVGQKMLSVVCGATNIALNQKVAVAKVGAHLRAIQKAGETVSEQTIQGVSSQGMLLSAAELGLAESSEGILIFPETVDLGQSVWDYLQLEDICIEIDLTPNRGDCLSLHGIAREIGTLNKMVLNVPNIEAVPASIDDTFPIKIEAKTDCPRYCGRVIRGITQAQKATPFWLQERLRRSNVRPISPVVDVMNYVMLELGQPMHAFDLQKLDKTIIVRKAKLDEKILLLDGQTMSLKPDTLVIADKKGAVAIAGIMGGEDSAVSDNTQDIFLESALFSPEGLAGKARQYGLKTDSSFRFERGVDSTLQAKAIERATRLILDICGGTPGPLTEQIVEEALPTQVPILLRHQKTEQLLGVSLKPEEIEDILKRLGFELSIAQRSKANGEAWQVVAPSFRYDVKQEVDLIEEVSRIIGYNNLPMHAPRAALQTVGIEETTISLKRLNDCLVDCGYQEAITYSFVDPSIQSELMPEALALTLANPIAQDMSQMRITLWAGLMQALRYNLHRQQSSVRLFETGLRFQLQDKGDLQQESVIAGVISGQDKTAHWQSTGRLVDFYDVKGHVEALYRLTNQPNALQFISASHPALHPGQSAEVMWKGKPAGFLGKLHPRLSKKWDIDEPVFLFELLLKPLLATKLPKFQSLSRYPSIRRDLAVVVDSQLESYSLTQVIQEIAGAWLQDQWIFDVYQGKGIDIGRKSVAMGLILQHPSRTLIDSEVDELMQKLVTALKTKFGAELRE